MVPRQASVVPIATFSVVLDAVGRAIDRSIQLSPIASVLSDPRLPGNPIVSSNSAFTTLTGYPPDEILGRNCRFLAGPRTEPWLTERISRSVRDRRPVLVEILNYKRDGTPFRNAVLVAPIFCDAGRLNYFMGSQVEIDPEQSDFEGLRREKAKAKLLSLSPRQRAVLAALAGGHRAKVIARQLCISEKTVKMHKALMLRKLGAESLSAAIRIAVEGGI